MTANSSAAGRGDAGFKAMLRSYFLNRVDGPCSGRRRQFRIESQDLPVRVLARWIHSGNSDRLQVLTCNWATLRHSPSINDRLSSCIAVLTQSAIRRVGGRACTCLGDRAFSGALVPKVPSAKLGQEPNACGFALPQPRPEGRVRAGPSLTSTVPLRFR
jgi:hypothetical protein